ncbi:MAG: hypothetical protein JSW70_02150 [Syntrophobacterales bacterium]|nr:MAG: hypothetical protein JSW70_02150 [Syntrophobacterales bacterium]
MIFNRLMHHKPLSIWIAYSDNLTTWQDSRIIMTPTKGAGNWDGATIGSACPPIRTEKGWLLIYHGVDEEGVYRLGVALLDLNDTSQVIERYPDPILEPEEDYELRGEVHEVVFGCGICEIKGKYFVYYGAANKVICGAAVEKQKLMALV